MNEELPLLLTIRLKRRPRIEELSHSTGLDADTLDATLRRALAAGDVEPVRDRVRITDLGRERLAVLIETERSMIHADMMSAAYHDFGEFNTSFKQLVTDWQLVDGTRPNDHGDAAYDAAIIERLRSLHERFLPFLARVAALAPRLGNYRPRFTAALDRIQNGDHTWLANPLSDSYHTVWFELHEDLIGLCGLTRHAEAAAGRAG
ncbi:hypothetical protein [Nocardia sp. R7R-8]|uniref:hypothetical protein n=1 Tax=Nocardia sp. R7R-8 TaxID=3459304 RepID=UPI00403E071C